MQATIALVLGVAVGAIVLATVGRGITPQAGLPPRPTALGWCAFAFGILALAAAGLMMASVPVVARAPISIALAVAAMVVGIGAMAKRDRHWPTWVGLGLGALPATFWVVFMLGEILGPRH